MAYIASDPEKYKGRVVGTGQCVVFVEAASGAPTTVHWKRGAKVRGIGGSEGVGDCDIRRCGEIYQQHGRDFAGAIYVGQDAFGLRVWDQWLGQPVHERTIHFHGGAAGVKAVNDGDAFFVVD